MLLLVGLLGPLQSVARACCAAPAAAHACCCPTSPTGDSGAEADGLRRACCRSSGVEESATPVELVPSAADPVLAPPAVLPSLTTHVEPRAATPSPPPDPRPPDHPLWLSLRTLRC